MYQQSNDAPFLHSDMYQQSNDAPFLHSFQESFDVSRSEEHSAAAMMMGFHQYLPSDDAVLAPAPKTQQQFKKSQFQEENDGQYESSLFQEGPFQQHPSSLTSTVLLTGNPSTVFKAFEIIEQEIQMEQYAWPVPALVNNVKYKKKLNSNVSGNRFALNCGVKSATRGGFNRDVSYKVQCIKHELQVAADNGLHFRDFFQILKDNPKDIFLSSQSRKKLKREPLISLLEM